MPDIADEVVIRDGNGIWKPATVVAKTEAGFIAEWVMSAGEDTILVLKKSTIAWRLADAAVPS